MAVALSFVICLAFAYSVDGDTRRVFGGVAVPISRYPYQAQVVRYKPNKNPLFGTCGGSIVDVNIVLTAGHCFKKGHFRPEQYIIRSGTSRRDGGGGTTHTVTRIVVHPQYAANKNSHSVNDVALAFVDPPFEYGENVYPVPLAATPGKSGDAAVTTGWGMTDREATVRPTLLQAATVRILDTYRCNTETKWKGKVQEGTFCATEKKQESSCKGDSGGPLVSNGKLIGLVSWGTSPTCIISGRPSVYANVTYYLDWIREETSGSKIMYV